MQFLFSFSLLWEKLGASRRLDPFISISNPIGTAFALTIKKNRIPLQLLANWVSLNAGIMKWCA